MYKIFHGPIHPRLYENIDSKSFDFFDIGNNKSNVTLVKNLMKEILDPNTSSDIRIVYEDFLKSRALNLLQNNKDIIMIEKFFNVFEKYYKNKNGLNFYLLKMSDCGDKVIDIYHSWNSKKEYSI